VKHLPLKIIFAGTPEFSVPTLKILIDSPHQVVSVYTQPDRPAGRGRQPRPSPVKQMAESARIPVYQPENFKEKQAIETLREQQPDIMIVVAYGLLLPAVVLGIPKYGCLNVHASLLPRWRGAAPIQRAILAGDEQTGITIMQMDEGLDTGAMLNTVSTEITMTDTGQDLHDRLSESGAKALLDVVNDIAVGRGPKPVKQDNANATYAQKLSKVEARVDWSLDAEQIDRQIRAFNPWPVAYTEIAGLPLRIWTACIGHDVVSADPGTVISLEGGQISVATGKGVIELLEVQPAGKRRMSAADFINSRREMIRPGTSLGTSER